MRHTLYKIKVISDNMNLTIISHTFWYAIIRHVQVPVSILPALDKVRVEGEERVELEGGVDVGKVPVLERRGGGRGDRGD